MFIVIIVVAVCIMIIGIWEVEGELACLNPGLSRLFDCHAGLWNFRKAWSQEKKDATCSRTLETE